MSRRLVVLAALAATAAHAQVNVSDDCHMWNELGARWTTTTGNTRVVPQNWYLAGLFHGTMIAETNVRLHFLADAQFADIGKGVTEICKAPENANVDLLHVLTAFKLKLEGASEQQVEETLRWARQEAAQKNAPKAAPAK